MSYCTFSRHCDITCFDQLGGGYITLVAKNRPKFDALPDLKFETAEEFINTVQKQVDHLAGRKLTAPAIGLPADGQEYFDPDLPSLLARLQSLKAMGYRVPAPVLAAIQADLPESSTDTD